ncbi:MAG: hypothetical protein NBV67_06485 [Tagaea sp.]|nr:hypothetical protein [Tagaea sp.]
MGHARTRAATLVAAATFGVWLASAPSIAAAQTQEDAGRRLAALAFRDAVQTPPPGYTGPVFKLSFDYPARKPDCRAPWLRRNVDFSKEGANWEQWRAYIQDIIDYAWEGQDPNLPDRTGWRTKVREETRWFHIPWMAYDGHAGREFAHGLTNELSTKLSTFLGRGGGTHQLAGAAKNADGSDPLFETWSVGMYNPCGAWSVGQAFTAAGRPATRTVVSGGGSVTRVNGLPFQPGTVVIKVLNTTATAPQVPYMKGSTTWTAHAHKQTSPIAYAKCERELRQVHMVQMDLAVVDPRSPTRWVYATLVYDGNARGDTVRSRMIPLGVQWGNDPQTFPVVSRGDSQPPFQTIHGPGVGLQGEHLGCGPHVRHGRLAGPVDNAKSSCLACHLGAFAASPVGTIGSQGTNIPAIFDFNGMCSRSSPAVIAANRAYFSNNRYPQRYPGSSGAIGNAIPLDTSLQLQVAFNEYATALNPPPNPECPPAQ